MTDKINLEVLALEISKVVAKLDSATKHDASNPMDVTILETLHKIGHADEGLPGIRPHILNMVARGEIKVQSTRGGLPPVNLSDITVSNFDKWLTTYPDAEKVRAVLLTSTQPQAAAVEAVPLVVAPASEPGNWKMQIQAEAAARFNRLRKSGANPTVYSLLNDMAKWCRDREVKTDGDIYPSANYLRTHVLGGKHWKPPR